MVMKRASDIIGDGSIDFYKEMPQVELSEILGKDMVLMDARILRDWDSEYGKSDWCLMYMRNQDVEGLPSEFTTKCGGKVLVRRIGELQARKSFPCIVSVVMQGNEDKPYYNIL